MPLINSTGVGSNSCIFFSIINIPYCNTFSNIIIHLMACFHFIFILNMYLYHLHLSALQNNQIAMFTLPTLCTRGVIYVTRPAQFISWVLYFLSSAPPPLTNWLLPAQKSHLLPFHTPLDPTGAHTRTDLQLSFAVLLTWEHQCFVACTSILRIFLMAEPIRLFWNHIVFSRSRGNSTALWGVVCLSIRAKNPDTQLPAHVHGIMFTNHELFYHHEIKLMTVYHRKLFLV